jgi:hypothetical protein
MTLDFSDKSVSYETFVNDVANSVARLLTLSRQDPEFISQRQAYTLFGRSNVDRWRKQGMVEPHKRPGKVEYRTAELRYLQRKTQDYFI